MAAPAAAAHTAWDERPTMRRTLAVALLLLAGCQTPAATLPATPPAPTAPPTAAPTTLTAAPPVLPPTLTAAPPTLTAPPTAALPTLTTAPTAAPPTLTAPPTAAPPTLTAPPTAAPPTLTAPPTPAPTSTITPTPDTITPVLQPAPLANEDQGLPTSIWMATSFIDQQHGWVADDQTLLATTDGGQHWATISQLPTKVRALQFIDQQRGWLTSIKPLSDEGPGIPTGRLYTTTDGGYTWAELSRDYKFDDLQFMDAQHGWATAWAVGPTLLRTTDGGRTWSEVPRICGPDWIEVARMSMSFVDREHGWVFCAGDPGAGHQSKRVTGTVDGGEHWAAVATSDDDTEALGDLGLAAATLSSGGYASTMTMLNRERGWYVSSFGGDYGAIWTNDGGRSWDWRPDDAEYFPKGVVIRQRFSATEAIGLTGGEHRAVLRTSDGGHIWQQLYPRRPPTNAVQFFDGQRGIGVGLASDPLAVLTTGDGGITWTWASTPSSRPSCAGDVTAITFATPLHGWALSQGCGTTSFDVAIVETTDGGQHWQLAPQYRNHILGLALAPFGGQPTSSMCGSAPAAIRLPLYADRQELTTMAFSDRCHGWAITTNDTPGDGTLLRTTDGGWTATPQTIVAKSGHILALSADEVWVSSGSAELLMLYHTTDGGQHWTRIELRGTTPWTFPPLLSASGATLWLHVGAARYQSDDGGATWHSSN